MAHQPAQAFMDFCPTQPFFVGIDSDGCVFDTMELKQKECFTPNLIRHFHLQAVSRFAREAAEFVNLYSRWRGINRFPALVRTLALTAGRAEVIERDFRVPDLPALRGWLEREPQPSNPTLEAALGVAEGPAGEELRQVLMWSRAVNASITDMVYGVPPIPGVRESLTLAAGHADLMVVSATPAEALVREWAEHDLADHVAVIAGQEMGTKAEHLALATGGKYASDHVLMVGDAPGDLAAARSNGALFFPITPGDEAGCWRCFYEEALERFFAGTYAGAFEAARVAEFEARLPATPPWKRDPVAPSA